ncbi:MAG: hypothetical protein H6622_07255 [Halobacteriovoraceae bacterium]|nr:hypothetical protein [Halobacteriovoraceae bacterium]
MQKLVPFSVLFFCIAISHFFTGRDQIKIQQNRSISSSDAYAQNFYPWGDKAYVTFEKIIPKGPVYENGQADDYVRRIFGLILQEAHNIAKDRYEKNSEEENRIYYSFLLSALSIPHHESGLAHFKRSQIEAIKKDSKDILKSSHYDPKEHSACHELSNTLGNRTGFEVIDFLYEDEIIPKCSRDMFGKSMFQLMKSPFNHKDWTIMQLYIKYHPASRYTNLTNKRIRPQDMSRDSQDLTKKIFFNTRNSINYGLNYIYEGLNKFATNHDDVDLFCLAEHLDTGDIVSEQLNSINIMKHKSLMKSSKYIQETKDAIEELQNSDNPEKELNEDERNEIINTFFKYVFEDEIKSSWFGLIKEEKEYFPFQGHLNFEKSEYEQGMQDESQVLLLKSTKKQSSNIDETALNRETWGNHFNGKGDPCRYYRSMLCLNSMMNKFDEYENFEDQKKRYFENKDEYLKERKEKIEDHKKNVEIEKQKLASNYLLIKNKSVWIRSYALYDHSTSEQKNESKCGIGKQLLNKFPIVLNKVNVREVEGSEYLKLRNAGIFKWKDNNKKLCNSDFLYIHKDFLERATFSELPTTIKDELDEKWLSDMPSQMRPIDTRFVNTPFQFSDEYNYWSLLMAKEGKLISSKKNGSLWGRYFVDFKNGKKGDEKKENIENFRYLLQKQFKGQEVPEVELTESNCKYAMNDINYYKTIDYILEQGKSIYHAHLKKGTLERDALDEIISNIKNHENSRKSIDLVLQNVYQNDSKVNNLENGNRHFVVFGSGFNLRSSPEQGDNKCGYLKEENEYDYFKPFYVRVKSLNMNEYYELDPEDGAENIKKYIQKNSCKKSVFLHKSAMAPIQINFKIDKIARFKNDDDDLTTHTIYNACTYDSGDKFKLYSGDFFAIIGNKKDENGENWIEIISTTGKYGCFAESFFKKYEYLKEL